MSTTQPKIYHLKSGSGHKIRHAAAITPVCAAQTPRDATILQLQVMQKQLEELNRQVASTVEGILPALQNPQRDQSSQIAKSLPPAPQIHSSQTATITQLGKSSVPLDVQCAVQTPNGAITDALTAPIRELADLVRNIQANIEAAIKSIISSISSNDAPQEEYDEADSQLNAAIDTLYQAIDAIDHSTPSDLVVKNAEELGILLAFRQMKDDESRELSEAFKVRVVQAMGKTKSKKK
ncbi:MAG: hypothetical protein M0R33_22385 [Methylomonas sp.]|jgi:hypothetical protein|uniref:hypothetical protein n=1 Tax=Methylomonas sp. TaxID=418 RepID=UPI0025CEEACC|nr:hypothetical protein [Methylomonas sp.]MCK9609193.1 hypothetical protein [Methylomonas sp.]